jgi:endo-1,4-beta-xylanase
MKTPPCLLRTSALLLAAALAAAIPLHAQPAAAAAATVTPYAPKAPESASLKATYKGIFHIGVAITPAQINGNNPSAAALIAREFDSIVAENDMKMGPIHPRAGNDDSSYNFGPADRLIEFGVQNNMFIIGHNLCWHSQMPGWMSQPDAGQATLTKEVLMQRLKDHIFKVVGRYKGKVKGWDVVNEAINDGGGYRQTVFYNTIGKEYLVHAFKWAHEADPEAELYYNDYNLDASDAKRATCVELVKYLKENGAPIHGVGMQGHYSLAAPSTAKIDETIKMFAALGVKVMITELDVTVNTNTNITGAVGANAGAPTNPGGAARGGARGAATPTVQPFVLPPALPGIEQLKTQLSLTDAQVAAITPLLDAIEKGRTAIVNEQTKLNDLRTAANTQISNLLTETQRPRFTQMINPPAAGGRGGRGGGTPLLNDAQQQALAKRYGEIFAVFLANRDSITRVTFWGLSDPESWRAQNSPLLFQTGYERKAAYDAVIHAVKAAGITVAK